MPPSLPIYFCTKIGVQKQQGQSKYCCRTSQSTIFHPKKTLGGLSCALPIEPPTKFAPKLTSKMTIFGNPNHLSLSLSIPWTTSPLRSEMCRLQSLQEPSKVPSLIGLALTNRLQEQQRLQGTNGLIKKKKNYFPFQQKLRTQITRNPGNKWGRCDPNTNSPPACKSFVTCNWSTGWPRRRMKKKKNELSPSFHCCLFRLWLQPKFFICPTLPSKLACKLGSPEDFPTLRFCECRVKVGGLPGDWILSYLQSESGTFADQSFNFLSSKFWVY